MLLVNLRSIHVAILIKVHSLHLTGLNATKIPPSHYLRMGYLIFRQGGRG